MDFATYQALDAVNWSTLKEMRRSPLHYRHRLDTPREDTPAFALGRAVHCAILESDRFALDYIVRPDGIDRRTKEGKAAWSALEATGRTILDVDDYRAACAMRDAVRRHPVAARLLESGEAEKTLTWTDAATGLACKGRLDWLAASAPRAIVDVKTDGIDIGPRFATTAAKFGYHTQLAFYREGWKAATGETLPVYIIAVEKAAPFDVVAYLVDEDALWAGCEEYAALLARVKECRESGVWPGRASEEQVLQLPAWVFPDDEDADGLGLVINERG